MPADVWAVSYTHLDVYKRQIKGHLLHIDLKRIAMDKALRVLSLIHI